MKHDEIEVIVNLSLKDVRDTGIHDYWPGYETLLPFISYEYISISKSVGDFVCALGTPYMAGSLCRKGKSKQALEVPT